VRWVVMKNSHYIKLLIIIVIILIIQLYLNFYFDRDLLFTGVKENSDCLNDFLGNKVINKDENYLIYYLMFFISSIFNLNILISFVMFYLLSFLREKLFIFLSAVYLLFVFDLTIPMRVLSLIEPMKSFYEFKPLFVYDDICHFVKPKWFASIFFWFYFIFVIVMSNLTMFLFFNKSSNFKLLRHALRRVVG
jgi:hypothetical protein